MCVCVCTPSKLPFELRVAISTALFPCLSFPSPFICLTLSPAIVVAVCCWCYNLVIPPGVFVSLPRSASLPRPVDLRVNTDDHILCLILLLLCEFVCSSDFPSHPSSFAKCAECIFRSFHIFRLILLSNTCDYLSYVAFYYCQICIRLDGPGSLVVSRQSLLPRLHVSFSLMVVCLGHAQGKGKGRGRGSNC